MRFLVDVNSAGILCEWLIGMGHHIAQVGDRNPRMHDEEILHWAIDEKRIIVTTDKDFEEMTGVKAGDIVVSCAWKICRERRGKGCYRMS